jgi:hypothetical protein
MNPLHLFQDRGSTKNLRCNIVYGKPDLADSVLATAYLAQRSSFNAGEGGPVSGPTTLSSLGIVVVATVWGFDVKVVGLDTTPSTKKISVN